MSDQGHGIGTALRTARVAQGLSIQDAANHLRLMHRQVEAMETEDFPSLGPSVFARGFVRNYARLLGLDHQALLQVMGGTNIAPIDVVQATPMVLPGARFTSGWLITGLLTVLALMVVLIGLYAWLNSDAEELAFTPTQSAAPISAPTSVPMMEEQTLDAPVSEASATPGTPVTVPTLEGTGPTQTKAKGEMRFEFDDNAWVEIKEGTGQLLQRQMYSKGSSLELTGQPPLSVVLGNAAQVRMTYNGHPLDLKPYIDGNVARFSLEE